MGKKIDFKMPKGWKLGHGWYEDHFEEGMVPSDDISDLATNLLKEKLSYIWDMAAKIRKERSNVF